MKKFDVVYPWVNGQDEVWRQKRIEDAKKYLDKDAWVFANVEGRFRDNDELLFSFRSLIPHLSKINKIYLITDNQTPVWFKNHPQVEIVSHVQLRKTTRPTYSSSALEASLHHIDGLLDSFVYMNDDVFLGGKWNFEKALGFDNDSLISEVYLEKRSNLMEYSEAFDNTKHIVSRNVLLEKFPDYQHTFEELAHGPKVFSRKAFFELEELFSDVFQYSKEEVFRQKIRVPIIDLYARMQIHLQKSKIGEADIRMLETHDEFLSHHFQSLKKDFSEIEAFCVNDTLDDDSNHPNLSLSKSELEQLFPTPSPFEKT